jgi:hypothetical protein
MKSGVMGSGLGDLGWEKALQTCKDIEPDAIEAPRGAF